jgi:hypothetical protein
MPTMEEVLNIPRYGSMGVMVDKRLMLRSSIGCFESLSDHNSDLMVH